MKILILNGSPRKFGNTSQMVAAFSEGAISKGHEVNVIEVCRKNIKGCLACEYCHGKGHGQCAQKDDMQEVYQYLADAEMLLIASPIYYHGITGQLKCTIDRFYAAAYPQGPKHLTKVGMILCSGASNQYDGAKFSFEGDFLGYLGLENRGFITVAGNVTAGKLQEARNMGLAL